MNPKYDNAMIDFLKTVAIALMLAAALSVPVQLQQIPKAEFSFQG
jgi:hypothetical protein